MAARERRYVDDVPEHVEQRLHVICATLPDAYEEAAWVGLRWRVRTRTFAHVLGVDEPDRERRTVLVFRSSGEELEALRRMGDPFFALGWGRNAMGMAIDESTDWDEVAELVTESFCVMAPKKLAALVSRPPRPASPDSDVS